MSADILETAEVGNPAVTQSLEIVEGIAHGLVKVHGDGSDFILIHGTVQEYDVPAYIHKLADFFSLLIAIPLAVSELAKMKKE